MSNAVLKIVPDEKKRRTTRIAKTVPVRVTGTDSLGRSFRERTYTLVISCHGCKYVSKLQIEPNSRVNLEIADPGAKLHPPSVQARVASVHKPGSENEYFQIGVELEGPSNVWGIEHPPEDWSPYLELGMDNGSHAPGAGAPSSPRAMSPGPAPVSKDGAEEHTRNPRTAPAPAPTGAAAGVASGLPSYIRRAVAEAAATAVARETSRVLGEVRAGLQAEARKSLETALASESDQWFRRTLQQISERQQASAEKLGDQWIREFEQGLRQAYERLTESLTASTSERLQRIAESSQRDAVAHFLSRLQQQLAVLLERSQDALTKLAASKEEVEQSLKTHRDSFEKALQQSALEATARIAETGGQLERQFSRVARETMVEALEELERKSAAAANAAIENLRTVSESYGKQAQGNLQAAFELAFEQAANGLQEKAGETLRVFAQQMEKQRRSQLEHIGRLTAELAKEIINRSRA